MHYVEVPKKIITTIGLGFKARLLCHINQKLKFQCGLMPLGGGNGYIMISKAKLKTLGAGLGDRVQIVLTADKSKYGLPMPAELKELLKQDEEGKKRFNLLSPGKQRNILHYVGSVKNSDARLERAVQLISNLKKCPLGKETFRQILGLTR